jgi:hypothetical protein
LNQFKFVILMEHVNFVYNVKVLPNNNDNHYIVTPGNVNLENVDKCAY